MARIISSSSIAEGGVRGALVPPSLRVLLRLAMPGIDVILLCTNAKCKEEKKGLGHPFSPRAYAYPAHDMKKRLQLIIIIIA